MPPLSTSVFSTMPLFSVGLRQLVLCLAGLEVMEEAAGGVYPQGSPTSTEQKSVLPVATMGTVLDLVYVMWFTGAQPIRLC